LFAFSHIQKTDVYSTSYGLPDDDFTSLSILFSVLLLTILDWDLLYLILAKNKINKQKQPSISFFPAPSLKLRMVLLLCILSSILLSNPCKQFNPFCISFNCMSSTLQPAEFFISFVISKTEAKVQQQRQSQSKWSSVT